jgi:hypothetical protein
MLKMEDSTKAKLKWNYLEKIKLIFKKKY